MKDLIERAQAGDKLAFDDFVNQSWKLVHTIAYRRNRENAIAITQATFDELRKNLHRIDLNKSIVGLIHTVVSRQTILSTNGTSEPN